MSFRDRILILIIFVTDSLLLSVSILIIWMIHFRSVIFVDIYPTLILLNACLFLSFLPFINEKLFISHTLISRLLDNVKKSLVYISLSSVILVVFNFDEFSRTVYLGSFILFFTLRFFVSYFYSYLIRNKREGEHYSKSLIIGAGSIGKAILEYYNKNPDKGHIVGFLDDFKNDIKKFNILGSTKDLDKLLENVDNNEINEIIIISSHIKRDNLLELILKAEHHGIRPRIVPDYYSLFNRNYEIQKMGKIPIINVREVKLDFYSNRFWKRVFDLIFSIPAIILCIPLFIIIAFAIKLESKGPIFYRPVRAGKHGIKFKVYKFRSMFHNDDKSHHTKSTVLNDKRITSVGRILRKYSLDELPQLFNVFDNKMSIVGPRPHRIYLNEEFRKKIYTYNVRQYIRPGITGWAQVNGWRGPTLTKRDYYGRTLHDLWYIENWSFGFDLYIIYLTLFGKKVRRNAF